MRCTVAAQHTACGEPHDGDLIRDTQLVAAGAQKTDRTLHVVHRIPAGIGFEAVSEDRGVESGARKEAGDMHAFTAGTAFKPAAMCHNDRTAWSTGALCGNENN